MHKLSSSDKYIVLFDQLENASFQSKEIDGYKLKIIECNKTIFQP